MPRYFFDLNTPDAAGSGEFDSDEVGSDFAGVEEAQQAALCFLPTYVQDILRPRLGEQTYDLRVRDEIGQIIYRVRLVLSGSRVSAELI